MRWRLQPEVGSTLEALLTSICGPDATPIDALIMAAELDHRAQDMLDDLQLDP